MKIAFLNDTHAGARNSYEPIIEAQEQFYSETFFPYLLKHDIKTIIHAGDFYDNRKSVSVKAQNANRKMFLNRLREYGIVMHIIPGNHDVLYTNTNDVCSLKEMLGFFTDCVKIYMRPTVIELSGKKILMLPWITDDNRSETFDLVRSVKDVSLVVGHFEFTGFSMYLNGHIADTGDSIEEFERFPLVVSGHYHHKSSKGSVNYLGTQFEMTWSDYNDPKYFHVYDTEDGSLTPILNPNRLFYRLEYSDGCGYDLPSLKGKIVRLVVNNRSNDEKYRDFIQQISSVGIADLSITDNHIFSINKVDTGLDVSITPNTELLADYVNSIGLDRNITTRVQSYLSRLYDTAMREGATE